MTGPTAPATPTGTSRRTRSRLVDISDLHPWDLARSSHLADQLWARASRRDYPDWLAHVAPAAGCARPIRLHGQMTTVEAETGRLLSTLHTADLPDGVIYKPCGNRRETVCPSCSKRYQRDAYRVFRTGLLGGGDIPTTVATHPALFVTLTAPSFGPVHTRVVRKHTCTNRRACQCRAEVCHPRRTQPTCPHGTPLACWARHDERDDRLGAPLCPDCYDYPAHVVWNVQAGELWRRTTETLRKHLRRLAVTRGVDPNTVKLSYGKAAEMQRRAVVHFHAIIRLDGRDPHDPTAVLPPPAALTGPDLADLIEHAVPATTFTTDAHPIRAEGWRIGWGTQLDVRPITIAARGEVTDTMVANYLAKYATKSTEITGHTSPRLTAETLTIYAHHAGTHPQRLVTACWTLGHTKPWHRLRRWAHMLGFGGHFATKSRRFTITLTHLRNERTRWRRTHPTGPNPDDHQTDPPTVLVVNFLQFVGAGWHTTGDALLANTSAALAREHRRPAGEALPSSLELSDAA